MLQFGWDRQLACQQHCTAGLVQAPAAGPPHMPAPAPAGRPPARLAGTLQGPAHSLPDAGWQAATQHAGLAKQGAQQSVRFSCREADSSRHSAL